MMRRCRPSLGILSGVTDAIDKAGSYYKPSEMSSKDVLHSPMKTNKAYDPVDNARRFKEMTGPLRRKMSMKLDNFVDVGESEKWMEVTHAAKLLNIKESELSTLTSARLEERWAKVYKEQSFAHQQETIVAAEVLMEYLDSNLFQKKSREYYKDYVESARVSIDHETQQRRDIWKQNVWLLSGVMMFGGCLMVVLAAYLNGTVKRDDIIQIGRVAEDYMGVVLTKPKNLEPAPNYDTRYLLTPSALELDEQSGNVAKRMLDPVLAGIVAQDEEYRQSEDGLTIRLINMENERIRREQKERELMESTVLIHRKEDYDADGNHRPTNRKAATTPAAEEPFATPSLSKFMSLAATQFGGSKTQRFVSNSMTHATNREGVEQRLRMVDPMEYAATSDPSNAGKDGSTAGPEA